MDLSFTRRRAAMLLSLFWSLSFFQGSKGFTSLPSTTTTRKSISNLIDGRHQYQSNIFLHRRIIEGPLSATASPITPIPNEFSRPLNTDRILKTSSGKQRRSYRDYRTTIEANTDECAALAKRFELTQLQSLKAELSLNLPMHYNPSSAPHLTVQVEGSILASLTQTCVRTNEDFDVTVEFPLSAIVKPVSNIFLPEEGIWGSANNNDNSSNNNNNNNNSSSSKTKPKSKRRNKNLKTGSIQSLNDMVELQQMIERQEDEQNFSNDEILEDEAIYSLSTGMLDVGELVAQSFWLNLDPYPKRPGSGPVEFTISG